MSRVALLIILVTLSQMLGDEAGADPQQFNPAKSKLGASSSPSNVSTDRGLGLEPKWFDDLGAVFSGSRIGLRWRRQEDVSGEITANRIVTRPRVNLTLPVLPDFNIRAQAQTGSGYGSGWDRIVTYGPADPNIFANFNMRRLFVDYSFEEHTLVEFGALNSKSSRLDTPPLSFDTDGWIDGLRIGSRGQVANLDATFMTLGFLDPLDEPSLFERSWGGQQNGFVQVQVGEPLSEQSTLFFDYAHLAVNDENFVRVDLETDFDEASWVSSIRNEVVIDPSDGSIRAASGRLTSHIGPLKVNLGAIHQGRTAIQRQLNDGIFRDRGNSWFVIVGYRIPDTGWSAKQRCRVCFDKSSCDSDFRCDSTLEYRFL